MTLTIDNLRLAGPKGEKPVADLGGIDDDAVVDFTPPTMDRARTKKFDHRLLTGGERLATVTVVAGSKPGRRAWQIVLKPGTTSITTLVPHVAAASAAEIAAKIKLDVEASGEIRFSSGALHASVFAGNQWQVTRKQ